MVDEKVDSKAADDKVIDLKKAEEEHEVDLKKPAGEKSKAGESEKVGIKDRKENQCEQVPE